MKNPYLFILFLIPLFMNSCTLKTRADYVFLNGKIYTVDDAFSVASAMAVKEGKILAVGSAEDIESAYIGDSIIDLDGRFVYPGFIDAHCHFYGLALMLQQADLSGSTSFDEVIDRLRGHHESFRSKWLVGRGWDQNLWPVNVFPDNSKLNQLYPDIPVVISRIDGHAVLANETALKIAEIDEKTKIEGGKIELKNGKLTGILIDKAADRMRSFIPLPSEEELKQLLIEAESECVKRGLTSVADAGLTKATILLMEGLQKQMKLRIGIFAMLDPIPENIDFFVKNGIYKKERIHVGAVKLYIDGALGSRGACLSEPYSDDPGNKGIIVESLDTLRYYCKYAYENNYQVCVHAIGDSGVKLVLNLYAEFLKGKNDRRWRIEHSQVVNKEDFALFGSYNIVPSVQPTHATSDMYWADERLGPDRIQYAYAYQDLMKQNAWIPLGTDFPIEKIDPLLTFYAAVFRKDIKGYPDGGFQIENALSREDALRGMTIWAAKSCFEEYEKGSLEKGKQADFVILDKDIMQIPEHDVLSTKILETYIMGEKVFDH